MAWNGSWSPQLLSAVPLVLVDITLQASHNTHDPAAWGGPLQVHCKTLNWGTCRLLLKITFFLNLCCMYEICYSYVIISYHWWTSYNYHTAVHWQLCMCHGVQNQATRKVCVLACILCLIVLFWDCVLGKKRIQVNPVPSLSQAFCSSSWGKDFYDVIGSYARVSACTQYLTIT